MGVQYWRSDDYKTSLLITDRLCDYFPKNKNKHKRGSEVIATKRENLKKLVGFCPYTRNLRTHYVSKFHAWHRSSVVEHLLAPVKTMRSRWNLNFFKGCISNFFLSQLRQIYFINTQTQVISSHLPCFSYSCTRPWLPLE